MTDYIATDTELTSVANAIRTKGGTNAQLSWPTGYVSAINAISAGGGDKAEPNDVTFIDYDGTVLYSYSASDFAQLTAMPANPDRTGEGLTAQGWNWTLANAKTQVASSGYIVIGQSYVPTDGNTHIFIDITKNAKGKGLKFALYFGQTSSGGTGRGQIDWGDGNTADCPNKSVELYEHTYQTGGKYEVIIKANNNVDSNTINLGGTSSSYNIVGPMDAARYYRRSYVEKVYIGSATTLSTCCFKDLYGLKCVTMPNSATMSVSGSIFLNCKALTGVVIPSGITAVPTYCLDECDSLKYVSLPETITSIQQRAFAGDHSLEYISIPDNVSVVGTYAFEQNFNLKRINIWKSGTQLGNYVFQQCYSLNTLTIPSNITKITSYSLGNIGGMEELHMQSDTPPTLANTALSIQSTCVIYVPRSTNQTVLNAYKAATNWSTYASYMQEEPA